MNISRDVGKSKVQIRNFRSLVCLDFKMCKVENCMKNVVLLDRGQMQRCLNGMLFFFLGSEESGGRIFVRDIDIGYILDQLFKCYTQNSVGTSLLVGKLEVILIVQLKVKLQRFKLGLNEKKWVIVRDRIKLFIVGVFIMCFGQGS